MNFRADNFISFHDLTPEARFLWASPTVYDLLGFEPDDLIGLPAYDIVLPVDIADSKTAHKENVMNDLVATQVVVRYKRKDGQTILFASLFSLCYDFIVHCATMLDPGAEAC
jgi:PAS domain S-box-containing protein